MFLAGTMNYKYITEIFFILTINTEHQSSLSNQQGANLCLKYTKMRLAAGLRSDSESDPLGELMRSADSAATVGSLHF